MDKIIKIWVYLSSFILLSLITLIIVFIFFKGHKVINFEFLFNVPKGEILGMEGGIAPAIVGSLISTLLACFISFFMALSTSIYMVFYNKNIRIAVIFQNIISCINAVPSIVLGLFGYSFFVLFLGLGRSILSGAFTLSIMIFPVIELQLENIFKALDKELINSSYSLGVSKSYTILKLILPMSKRKFVSVFTLAFGYAIGATAPIMFCMAVINSPISFSLKKPTMTLSYHLYILLTQGISIEMGYGTAAVLLGIIFIVNILGYIFTGKRGGKV